MLTQLTLEQFRNFKQFTIEPASRINLILGENGSGKTSLLEAIHLLGLGRSFRTRQLKNTIQTGFHYSRAFARIDGQTPVGFQYDIQSGIQIRLNNAPLQKLSDLAAHLPLQFIPANCHAFFESGPRFRRRLVDWGLFHVEHEFLFHWQAYRKALLQRNASIKQNKRDAEIQLWNKLLAEQGEAIHQLRIRYLKNLLPLFEKYFKQICPALIDIDWRLRYQSGWSKDESLSATLDKTLSRDRALGYTRAGIHAADWTLRMNGADPAEMLSRGQQKLFFIALSLAAVEMLSDDLQSEGLLLIDDLSAELDQSHQSTILTVLSTLPVQSYLTSTQTFLETSDAIAASLSSMVFHVKHGALLNTNS